ncbi:PDP protein [Helicobacter muridarum]|uniref:Flagellar protein FlbB n=1 Tax=Helicobacter muridarum TaxID=216 RepID=A0A377PTR1_9HELI|nr:PDP protein [Helicobacter muridarum]TLE00197.1 PDP protein [Helicobacter muridarum]STQ85681.1 flagellar protein FlbB [Helicobacter muridarum]
MKQLLYVAIIACSTLYSLAADSNQSHSTKEPLNSGKINYDPEAAQALAKQCTAIFEARKDEIAFHLSKLQQQQSTLQILTEENTKLLKEKEEQIKLKEQALQQMYGDMKKEQSQKQSESDAKLAEAKALLAKNEEILKQINGIKENKLAESYAKMKDNKAAPIIAAMPNEDAILILLSLKPNQMGSILAQMQPDKAAELSKLIRLYPGIDQNASNQIQPEAPTQAQGVNVDNIAPNANITQQPSSYTRGTTIY